MIGIFVAAICGSGDRPPVLADDNRPAGHKLALKPTVTFAGARIGQIRDDNSLKTNLVWISAGNFTMGSPKDDVLCFRRTPSARKLWPRGIASTSKKIWFQFRDEQVGIPLGEELEAKLIPEVRVAGSVPLHPVEKLIDQAGDGPRSDDPLLAAGTSAHHSA
jgi:hypothetical protein